MTGPAEEALDRALAAIDEREHEVRAWAYLDAEGARQQAIHIDAACYRPSAVGGSELGAAPALVGLILGVKDIFDTAAMPTSYGSPIYEGYRPRADAAAVSLLSSAGAVVLGKTVTAELAMYEPGPTRNPHRPTHTPGGSSSGSAAAVATGMADIALGTQTAGSIIRPASFCGVWGLKPSFGSVPVAGLKLIAPSLDTVGWLAGTADQLGSVLTVLTGHRVPGPMRSAPRLGLMLTEHWDEISSDGRAVVMAAARRAEGAGAVVSKLEVPAVMQEAGPAVPIIQAYEAARSLAWERAEHPGDLSVGVRRILDWGAGMDTADYDRAREQVGAARLALPALLGDVDALMTPAVLGEAPEGLASTGDPRLARLWTALGPPALSVPGLTGATGLPIGVQLIGPSGGDARLVACGRWLGRVLADA